MTGFDKISFQKNRKIKRKIFRQSVSEYFETF